MYAAAVDYCFASTRKMEINIYAHPDVVNTKFNGSNGRIRL
jgi:hypothetical protein